MTHSQPTQKRIILRQIHNSLNDKIISFSECQGVRDPFYFRSLNICMSMSGDSSTTYESQGLTAYNYDEAVKLCESKNMKLATPISDKDFYNLLLTWKRQIAEKDPRKISNNLPLFIRIILVGKKKFIKI